MKSSNMLIRLSVLSLSAIWLALAVGTQAQAQGVWETKAPMPTARLGVATGVIAGQLYVATGALTTALEVYNPGLNTWTTKASIPTNRAYASAEGIDGKLYVVGGCINSDCNAEVTNILQVYDSATNTWTTKASMSTARASMATGVIAGKLYVVGGFHSCAGACPITNMLEVYDPATNTWTTKASMPTPRAQMGGAVINGKLHVVGGTTDGTSPGSLATLEVYDPSTDVWTTKAPMPTPRMALGAGEVEGILYAVSGHVASGISVNTVEAYDPATNTWTTVDPIPTARYGPKPQGINGALYVAANGPYPTAISTLEAFIVSAPPIAKAGPDQTVEEGTLVTLDGSGSSDPNGKPLTYTWTHVAGPPISLAGANTANPTFTAPSVPLAGATATFQLVVCKETSSNCSDPDSVNVHITNVNQPPVAQAGPDQTVREGSPVQLDGTASYDPDLEALTYQWTRTFGPAVTLSGSNTAISTFVAPNVGPAGDTIVFDLTVTDPHTLTGSDSVSIHVSNVNQDPVVDAGPDQTVNENTLVTLNGLASSDPDLDALSYSWTQTAGPSVLLTGGTTANPTFTAPPVVAGGTTLTFRLVVSDGQASSPQASSPENTVNIHVQDTNDPPVCALAQPSVASLWPPNHTMVPVSIMGVTDPNNQAITITYTAVTQDEPVNGLGDGDSSPDAAVSGNQILLRAERSGTGNGRVYAVHFTATDDQGASCSGTVKVSVPHSKKDPAGEGPQAFNSFTP